MKLIIPMAGVGKRMRPHTLNTPKPLINIAGKPIVQRLVEEISSTIHDKIDEIGFVIGNFGEQTENKLKSIAKEFDAKPYIFYQKEPLGTAHAVYCAEKIMQDEVIIAFADTLFHTNLKIDTSNDGIIWVKKVKDPSQFGVVKTENNIITDFIEKPKDNVSDMAIIGIYYFKKGEDLKKEIKYLLDNNVKGNNEYQITDALENLKNKGTNIKIAEVNKWMDCGNVKATINTNKEILSIKKEKEKLKNDNIYIYNSTIIEPVYLADNVKIKNSVVGPFVSVHDNTKIENSIIRNSIINECSEVNNIVAEESFIGNYTDIKGKIKNIDAGDYSKIKL